MTRAERDALVKQWSGLPKRVLKRIGYARLVGRDDLLQVGQLALRRAAKGYEPKKGLFIPYAWRAILTAMLDLVREWKRQYLVPIGFCFNVPARPPREEIDTAPLMRALRFLPARWQSILRWHFWEGLTLQEVGERLGITRQRAQQLKAKALAKLRTILEGEPAYA
ncbi:MAG TPA: sigma-70 family RNA polymerase sigma factor [Gemmataceae bacterium]|jgi:RNA polymerase sigma factor (sigma-70 family)|nr:sigma-70 family RNA polymerase sigma factor [Gemmataceae bacterium]